MAEPTTEANKLQTYASDQAVSVNSFFETTIDGEQVKLQITNRFKASPEQIANTVEAQIEAWKQLRAKYPRPTILVANPDPMRVAVGESGDPLPPVKSFIAEKLSVSTSEGKTFFKVKGGNFTQYGVPVWPEVLNPAGIVITDPANPPSIQGWKAEYIEYEKNGKKQMKVTRLLKP